MKVSLRFIRRATGIIAWSITFLLLFRPKPSSPYLFGAEAGSITAWATSFMEIRRSIAAL